jgi:hypothetical protein
MPFGNYQIIYSIAIIINNDLIPYDFSIIYDMDSNHISLFYIYPFIYIKSFKQYIILLK